MGKVLIPGGGGGGAISDDITLRQSDVPVGLTAVTFDSDDEIVEGTLTTTASPDKVLKDETFYNTETHQKESGTIESMEAQTITPGASAQTVSCTGKYMTGDVTINAVAGLSAGNIANGVTVGGVSGTYKGLGNVTQAQVLSGKTFSTATLSNASGTMTNYSGYTSTSNYVSSTFRSGTTGYVFVSPGGTGYYTTGSYLRIPATNLAAGNIKKGVTILGITGTFQGMVDSPYYLLNKNSSTSGGHLSVASGMRYYPLKVAISSESHFYDDYDYGYDNMYLRGTCGNDSPGGWILWRLSDSAISLAAYNTLYIKATVDPYGSGGAAQLGISTSGSVTSNSFNASINLYEINQGTFSLNISSLNSTYWFYFYQNGGATGSRGTSGTEVWIYSLYLVS